MNNNKWEQVGGRGRAREEKEGKAGLGFRGPRQQKQ